MEKRLVLIPALLSLAVTLLRLTGELLRWSEAWFSTATGGIAPSRVSWVLGVTWLAAPFGAYFGWRLVGLGEMPPRPARAIALALLGAAGGWLGLRLARELPIPFPLWLVPLWLVMAAAAAAQLAGWPALFRTLLLYGFASRIPVVLVMFLAMAGNWGTHYDYVGMPEPFRMPFAPRFLWLAFFPQLVFWLGFTIVVGSLAGSVSGALAARRVSADEVAHPATDRFRVE